MQKSLINFGRTCSIINAHADELVPDSWRVKNANDIVTRVPSLLGYHHIGVEVQMFADGQLTISRESSDDLREGAFAADILPKIKGASFLGSNTEDTGQESCIISSQRSKGGTLHAQQSHSSWESCMRPSPKSRICSACVLLTTARSVLFRTLCDCFFQHSWVNFVGKLHACSRGKQPSEWGP